MLFDPRIPETAPSRGFPVPLEGTRSVLLQASSQGKDPALEFAASVAAGLERRPRSLDCRFLYDEEGSRLYEEITRQPEYYLTRTEASLLARYAVDISRLTGPATLVEFGSGYSVKTDYLLSAYEAWSPEVSYLPVDVSDSALRGAICAINRAHPAVRVIALHGTFEEAFALFDHVSPILALFLGSTVGNMNEEESRDFFTRVADHLRPGDHFLLGVDLLKDKGLLEAAYNDAAGVSAAFTGNLFVRMNRELGSQIDTSGLEHVARFDAEKEQIEIHARFLRAQTLELPLLQRSFRIEAGEEILTEISRKYRIETLLPEMETVGFRLRRLFTDERRWFALLLLEKG
ncbi:dimethylhistidine N-methyltransferase [Desulfuromonas soudanensis]|uniref:Dimethylhistidine N-methyltransferase n=1 Tax=Desulfuromonas soudanensis TaxID=1603606 RepID=A0A0M3QGL1_9BACT|nr:L-histidine N(alpha)-methyltransferase [Desulfuromonas soudanensis]ALC17993.1 dimethylhistidine N-methyltransferase [Desulfuromonas soudanensis]